MTKAERTDVAVAFLQEIYDKGYTPMFYAACSELTNNSQWNIASLEKSFKIGLHNIRQRLIQRLHPHHIQEHTACGSILIRQGSRNWYKC